MKQLSDIEIMRMYSDLYGSINRLGRILKHTSWSDVSDLVKDLRNELNKQGFFKESKKKDDSKVKRFIRKIIGKEDMSEQFDETEDLVEENTDNFNARLQSMANNVKKMNSIVFERFLREHKIKANKISFSEKEKEFEKYISKNPDTKPNYYNVMKNTNFLLNRMMKYCSSDKDI